MWCVLAGGAGIWPVASPTLTCVYSSGLVGAPSVSEDITHHSFLFGLSGERIVVEDRVIPSATTQARSEPKTGEEHASMLKNGYLPVAILRWYAD